jgi:hypothetical protein
MTTLPSLVGQYDRLVLVLSRKGCRSYLSAVSTVLEAGLAVDIAFWPVGSRKVRKVGITKDVTWSDT